MRAPFFNFGKMISFWRSYEHGFDEEQMRQFMAQLESSRTLKKLGYEKRLLCSIIADFGKILMMIEIGNVMAM